VCEWSDKKDGDEWGSLGCLFPRHAAARMLLAFIGTQSSCIFRVKRLFWMSRERVACLNCVIGIFLHVLSRVVQLYYMNPPGWMDGVQIRGVAAGKGVCSEAFGGWANRREGSTMEGCLRIVSLVDLRNLE